MNKNRWVRPNRCLDLCCKHPTNHLHHPSQQSASPPTTTTPHLLCAASLFLVVNFTPQIVRISSGTLERRREETWWYFLVIVPLAYIWGREWHRPLKGQSSNNKLTTNPQYKCMRVCVCVSLSPLLDVLFILLQYWFYLFFQFRNSEKHTNTQMENNTKIARAGEASELRMRCADTDSWCVSCFSALLLMWQSFVTSLQLFLSVSVCICATQLEAQNLFTALLVARM